MRDKTALEKILKQLRSLKAENEVVEFKEAKTQYHFDKIGEYFSALSNEANLKGQNSAWLVFGIRDKDKSIVGSQFRPVRSHLDNLKLQTIQQVESLLLKFMN
jgi:ATP-dependent DNA helicase RecG